MKRVEKTVFISYRRTNAPWALAIYHHLTHHGFDVFFDYLSIASGDFEQVVLQSIKARAHFIVLLTPSALERCEDPGDWLRREIETALESQRNIVPLMLEGFDFATPALVRYLTGTLSLLKNYNAIRVPVDFFDEAMTRLREKFLNVPLDAVLHPVSTIVRQSVKTQQIAANAAPKVKEKELTALEWAEKGYAASTPDEKIHCYNEAIRLKPDDALAYNNRGLAHQEKGELDNALNDYNEAIRLEPDYALAFINRGNARTDKDDFDGALKDYNEAIRLQPDNALGYYNRGLAYETRGNLDNALSDYNEAIRLNPNDASAYNNRGSARKDKGDLDNALKDFDEAIRLRPNAISAYSNRGSARTDKGDLDGALKDFSEAIRLQPDNALLYYNRGFTYQTRGDLDNALNDYNEAIRLNPNDASAYNNRGSARKDKGDLDGALKDYSETIRLKPDYDDAYYNRAHVFKRKGDRAAAIADFQKYLALGGALRAGDQRAVEEMISELKRQS